MDPLECTDRDQTSKIMPTFPIEVWENGIDWLVAGYSQPNRSYNDGLAMRRDLSSCSLVCRAWLPRARMHLFSNIRLKGSGLSIYASIIRKSPMILPFAKELHFFNTYPEESDNDVTGRTIETATHLIRIIHKLPNLYFLVLGSIDLSIEHPHLPRYVAALRSINELQFLTRTPTSISHLANFLGSFPNLTTLTLSVPIIVPLNIFFLPSLKARSSLAMLFLIGLPGIPLLLNWLVLAHAFTTSLQKLHMAFQDSISQSELVSAMQGLQSLLENCRASLKEWVFWANKEVGYFKDTPSVSLATNLSLKHLKFAVSRDWFKHALQQLKTITSKNTSDILICYWLDKEESPEEELWKELDDILDADHFSSLTKVEVTCIYRNFENGHFYNIEGFNRAEKFPQLLPKLSKRGILAW